MRTLLLATLLLLLPTTALARGGSQPCAPSYFYYACTAGGGNLDPAPLTARRAHLCLEAIDTVERGPHVLEPGDRLRVRRSGGADRLAMELLAESLNEAARRVCVVRPDGE